MAERNAVKPRKCDTCFETFDTTAMGIKKHARTCEAVLDELTKPAFVEPTAGD